MRHIVFDIDGTLLDSEKTGLYSLQKTIREQMGKEMSLEELYPYFGIPSRDAIRLLGFPNPEYVAELWEQYFQDLKSMIVPFTGVEEMLEKLKASGKVLGILTSRLPLELHTDPNLAKWEGLFDFIVCSQDTTRHKPFPDPMLCWMEKAGSTADDTLYVGDTIYDCKCAQSAGVKFALVLMGKREQGDIPADYIIRDWADLLKIVL